MTEYIVNVPTDEAEAFVARFGFEDVRFLGYQLTGEIVRCMDCVFYDTHTEPPCCYRDIPGRTVEADGFCLWGERRKSAQS